MLSRTRQFLMEIPQFIYTTEEIMNMKLDQDPKVEAQCVECGAEIRSDEPYVCEYCDRHICDRCINNCGTTKDGWPVCNNHEPPDRPDEDWRENR